MDGTVGEPDSSFASETLLFSSLRGGVLFKSYSFAIDLDIGPLIQMQFREIGICIGLSIFLNHGGVRGSLTTARFG